MFNSVGGASNSFKLLDVEHLHTPPDMGVLTLDLLQFWRAKKWEQKKAVSPALTENNNNKWKSTKNTLS